MAQSDENQPFGPAGADARQSRALVERRETLPSTEVIRDSMTEEDEEVSINLRQYWAVIMRRKWTVLTFFAIGVVAGMTATYLTTPIYRASTTLQIDQEEAKIVPGTARSGNCGAGPEPRAAGIPRKPGARHAYEA